jgi:LysM repeat protein
MTVLLAGLALATLLAGCASRTVVEEEPAAAATASAPKPQQPAFNPNEPAPTYGRQQGVGANPAVGDDPAKRRGPQGQPAPYGRDTVTGLPLSDLPPQGAAPARPAPAARPAPTSRPPQTAQGPAASGTTVVVGRGETLYAIARRHNVRVETLMQANNLTTDRIQAGQTLVIPVR